MTEKRSCGDPKCMSERERERWNVKDTNALSFAQEYTIQEYSFINDKLKVFGGSRHD
jgi:hypothetical protein